MSRPRFLGLGSTMFMQLASNWFLASCCLVFAGVALAGCGDGGRPRQLEPGVLHDNGGGSGAGGTGGSGGSGLGGTQSDGGTGGDDNDELDAGTGGYQIGTDWDGNTRPTSENVRGIDAAAGEDDRGAADPDGGDAG